MQAGIPKELWKEVTRYADGECIQAFAGNDARCLISHPRGREVCFHDRGFPGGALNTLRRLLDDIEPLSQPVSA